MRGSVSRVVNLRSKRAKWVRWLRLIGEDLGGLLAWREAYESAADVTDSRESAEWQQLQTLLRDTYTHAMAMGVRRQLKLGSRNVTIAGLLEDLAANATQAGEAGATARADLAALRQKVHRVESFADRAVAHADRRSSRPLPLDELHEAVTALVRVRDRYVDLLGVHSDLQRG